MREAVTRPRRSSPHRLRVTLFVLNFGTRRGYSIIPIDINFFTSALSTTYLSMCRQGAIAGRSSLDSRCKGCRRNQEQPQTGHQVITQCLSNDYSYKLDMREGRFCKWDFTMRSNPESHLERRATSRRRVSYPFHTLFLPSA